MVNLSPTRLRINFSANFETQPVDYNGDVSGIIPASTLGKVVASTNDLMIATWNYAFTNNNDERFDELRRLEAAEVVRRKDVELVIVAVERGSLEITLDWATIIGIVQSVTMGMVPNAMWDLTKYSLQSLSTLITMFSNERREITADPLINQLLPNFAEIARHAYSSFGNGASVRTNLLYREPEREVSITIDQYAQRVILDANQINTQFTTRLVGHIVGVDFSENAIGIRLEQFPEQTIWTEIGGFDFNELSRFLPRYAGELPKRVGFDVEVGWRRGAANILPPDIIRVIQIVPEEELLNPNFIGHFGLSRPPLLSLDDNLNPEEYNFLKWFAWADTAWTDPNMLGTINYLLKKSDILGRKMIRQEIEVLIERLLMRGILVRTQPTRSKAISYQVFRLNRTHPAITRHQIR